MRRYKMKYTVMLTEDRKGNFYAQVPGIPDCNAKAKTRKEAIDIIRNAIANVVRKSEIIQLDVPVKPKAGNLHSETPWEFFGAFKGMPLWGELYDEIERQRDMN